MKSYKLQRFKRQVLFLTHTFITKLLTIKKIFKRKNIYVLITLIIIAFILMFYPVTRVEFQVYNKTLITNAELAQIKQITKKNNFFLLNPTKLKKLILHNFHNISDIQIQKELPGHILIRITETNYLGVLHIEGKYFLLTSENKILPAEPKVLQNPHLLSLPSIYSTTYNPIFIRNIHELIIQYNQLLLNDKTQTKQLTDLSIQKIYNIITLNHIPTIKIQTSKYIFLISPTKDLRNQIITLKILLTSPSLRFTKFKIIDLRFDRPVIK